LKERPQLVVANKMDSEAAENNLKKFQKKFPAIEVFPLIAILQEGCKPLLAAIVEKLKELPNEDLVKESESRVIYRYESSSEKIKINRERENYFRISGKQAEGLVKRIDVESEPGMRYFSRQMTKLGIDQLLRDAGAKDGDLVAILDFEFEFVE
jgi:GTP-binding protein